MSVNKEKREAYKQLWLRNNKEKARAASKKWRLNNPEKYIISVMKTNRKARIKNKEKIKTYLRNWQIINSDKSNAISAKRRALKKQAIPEWTDKNLVEDIYAEAKYFGLVVDHIIPLNHPNVCGLHWEGNLQLLTAIENLSKGNKLISIYQNPIRS